ncbi:MAG: site-specific integrase [Epsilonproteobacteria bacterium]|nr:MAG: site-specific integrase [Campylobacterota bacterium]
MARQKSKKFTGVYYQELKNNDKSYYVTYKEHKKDIWKKIGKHSEGIREAYCHQKRNEIISKIRLGEELPFVAMKKEVKTFLDIAKEFYDYKSIHNKQNKKTRARVEKRIQSHTIGSKSIKSITKLDIEDLQLKIQKELMPATVNFIVDQIGSIFNWSIENEITDKNPCRAVKRIKVNNARLRYLELHEIKRLKEILVKDKILYYFVLIGLATGGRLQTICNIKPSDFKKNGTVRLFDFKNNSEYYGFIDMDFNIQIKQFILDINKKDDEYLFKTTANQNYTNQYYYRKLQPIFNILFNPEETESLDKVTIHTLRHTFASQLAISETPILTIKKLMNHNDINATMRYAKLSKSSGELHANRLTQNLMSL